MQNGTRIPTSPELTSCTKLVRLWKKKKKKNYLLYILKGQFYPQVIPQKRYDCHLSLLKNMRRTYLGLTLGSPDSFRSLVVSLTEKKSVWSDLEKVVLGNCREGLSPVQLDEVDTRSVYPHVEHLVNNLLSVEACIHALVPME